MKQEGVSFFFFLKFPAGPREMVPAMPAPSVYPVVPASHYPQDPMNMSTPALPWNSARTGEVFLDILQSGL